MRHLCQINNLTNNIEILNLGISNKIGKYSVSMKENKWSMNTGGWQWTPDENGIEFDTLDNLWKKILLATLVFSGLCSMDGKEILLGGQQFLQHCKPYILMEYWTFTHYEEDNITININTAKPGSLYELENDMDFNYIFNLLNITILKESNIIDDFLLKCN